MRRDDDHTPTVVEICIVLLLAIIGGVSLIFVGYGLLIMPGMW